MAQPGLARFSSRRVGEGQSRRTKDNDEGQASCTQSVGREVFTPPGDPEVIRKRDPFHEPQKARSVKVETDGPKTDGPKTWPPVLVASGRRPSERRERAPELPSSPAALRARPGDVGSIPPMDVATTKWDGREVIGRLKTLMPVCEGDALSSLKFFLLLSAYFAVAGGLTRWYFNGSDESAHFQESCISCTMVFVAVLGSVIMFAAAKSKTAAETAASQMPLLGQ